MKRKFIILCLSVFLIGNFHVVTDWCDDLSDTAVTVLSKIAEHDSDNDLCGHCGHIGLNVLVIFTMDFELPHADYSSNPQADIKQFKSVSKAPPNPPPVLNA